MMGVKFWYDGSPYTGSMYLNEPFKLSAVNQEKIHVPSGHSGKALWNKDEIANRIQQYDSAGWQVAVHTQGDRAISETLNAFEKSGISKNSRHRLEHCLLPSKKDIQRMETFTEAKRYFPYIKNVYEQSHSIVTVNVSIL